MDGKNPPVSKKEFAKQVGNLELDKSEDPGVLQEIKGELQLLREQYETEKLRIKNENISKRNVFGEEVAQKVKKDLKLGKEV